jgi:hypothetical protein
MRGGKREKCTTCGDVFPCRKSGCQHLDCHEARGELPPDIIVAVDGVPIEGRS